MDTAQDPTFEFTSVPAFGSYHRLKGIVRGVEPERVRVAVYIRVHGGWWTKPYWNSPATAVADDGSFSVDVTTGGQDEQATEITAFLIRGDYYPPSLRGDPDLPKELLESAIGRIGITRTP